MGEGIPEFPFGAWVSIIGESLVKRDLVALCGRLEIEFKGRRLESLPEAVLAEPLARLVLEGGAEAEQILERVRRANQMLSESVKAKSVDELRDSVGDPDCWPGSVTAGRLMWALAADSRSGVRRLGRHFRDATGVADRLMAAMDDDEGPGARGAATEFREAAEKLSEIVSDERRRAERDARRIRSLEEQIAALRQELAERDQRISARKVDLEKSQEQVRRLERELESARAKLKAHPPESWESERKRLLHEVAELRRGVEQAASAARDEREALAGQFEGRLRAESEAAAEAREQAEAARKEAAWLRERLKSPVPAAPPPRRDSDRVAVFAEVQSLYFLARARSSRVDYRQVLERARADGLLGRALAYVVDVPGTQAGAFKQVLQNMGFQVRAKPGIDAGVWTSGLETDLRDAARTCGRIAVATANPRLANVLGELAAAGIVVTLLSVDDPSIAPLRSAASAFVPIGGDMLRPIVSRD
jgi:uncharacterized coiled-coil protein SlyX